MNKQQSGFTLIELVVVIVILGILAATALPKFIDLKADAEASAVKGVAGAVTSAFAVNYAGYQLNKGTAVSGAGVVPSSIANSIMVGGLPSGYVISPATVDCGTSAGGSAGAAIAITISNTTASTNNTAPATLICTG